MAGFARIVWICAATFIAAPSIAEDLTIVSKTTFGNREGTATHYLTAERSKSSSAEAESIVSYADGKMTMVDHKRKEYWQTSIDEMEEYWERMARQMRTSGAGDMFDLRGEAKLEKLKGSRKFAGYDCEHWSLQLGDALEVDFWAAPSLVPPVKYYDARRLNAAAMGPMGALFQRMYEELKKVKGYPLSTAVIVRTPFFRTESDEEATEVRKGAIPAATFELPSGYKKVKSPFEKR